MRWGPWVKPQPPPPKKKVPHATANNIGTGIRWVVKIGNLIAHIPRSSPNPIGTMSDPAVIIEQDKIHTCGPTIPALEIGGPHTLDPSSDKKPTSQRSTPLLMGHFKNTAGSHLQKAEQLEGGSYSSSPHVWPPNTFPSGGSLVKSFLTYPPKRSCRVVSKCVPRGDLL